MNRLPLSNPWKTGPASAGGISCNAANSARAAALIVFVAIPTTTPAALADVFEAEDVDRAYYLSEFEEPGYGPGFEHFAYADPDAPKGGSIVLSSIGTFDSLNSVPLGGDSPRNLGLLHSSLMTGSQDEIGVVYGLIAESVSYPADRSSITFHLREEAVFHDGEPITADDVAWTFEQVMQVGRPFLKSFYDDVEGVEVLDDQTVRFSFTTTDSMKPLARIAGLTVYPRHWWEDGDRDIGSSTLEIPLGSGPYELVGTETGRSMTFARVDDWWGADLPVNRGHYNFDRIRYDFYRDPTIAFEAFLGGGYDFRWENSAQNWAVGYDSPAVDRGEIVTYEIPERQIGGMYGLMMNHRLDRFEDRRVRRALTWLFDFQWLNENVFYDQYVRQETYFDAEGFSAEGVPEGRELELLEPFRDDLPPELFEEPFELPVTDGSGNIRTETRQALRLFQEAGWEPRNGQLVNTESGEPFEFEVLIRSSTMERVIQPYARNLERIGIDVSIRLMEPAQWERRMRSREFETAVLAYTFFPPPGTELFSYYGSEAAEVEGSANYMGIASDAVDSLIREVVDAGSAEDLRAASAALDRVLLWGYHVVPFFGADIARIAAWDKFGMPDTHPDYSIGLPNSIGFQPTWWYDENGSGTDG
ncbi:extracellular solute-binding protein [Fodinicurvata sp. EGI_FJ10296]|uniref:extracellular solute-binding protein n=1 Tax=Fodinicurvata sp. EGI_FJ10296 TaxID=3231908 RepID=UPI00345178EC